MPGSTTVVDELDVVGSTEVEDRFREPGVVVDGTGISSIGRAGVRRTATDGETYSGAKRLWPGQTISVVGITCTAFKRATITCETRKGAFRIVGGVALLLAFGRRGVVGRWLTSGW